MRKKEASTNGVRQRINAFSRKMAPRFFDFAASQEVAHFRYDRRQILDFQNPFFNEITNDVAADPDLDAVVVKSCSSQASFGIPLHMNDGFLELTMPIFLRPKHFRVVQSEDGFAESLLPSCP